MMANRSFSLFGHYIPPVGLANLHRYKYSSGGSTPLDRLMTPFWEWVALRVPVYVHPNVLTLMGVVAAVCGVALQLGYSPHLFEAAPSWVYLLTSLLYFIQQTCDAIDGKHARRTGMSSPLGQLFDHGGDIMLTTPMATTSMAFITAGTGLVPHIIAMGSSQLFQFIYMWWELHFHVFYAATGFIGVTEAQLGVIAMGLISGFFGPSVWRYNLLKLLPSSSLKNALSTLASAFNVEISGVVLVQLLLVVCNLWALIYNISSGVRRSQRPGLAASHILGFLSFMLLQGTIWNLCLNGPPATSVSPLLLYFMFNTTYSIFLLRLCLSATCRFTYPLFHWPLLPFVGTAVAVCTSTWCQQRRLSLFLGVSAWNTLYLADFLHTCVTDVCNSLGICCFRVDMKKVLQQQQKLKQQQQQQQRIKESEQKEEEEREEQQQQGLRRRGSEGGRCLHSGSTEVDERVQQDAMEGSAAVAAAAAPVAAVHSRAKRVSNAKSYKGLGVNGDNDISHDEAERRRGA